MEGSEDMAFTAFHHYFPNSPLLIDTFDTVEAAQHLAAKVKSGEINLKGVRLDSGDLVALSREVRSLLPGVSIFASGDLDEFEIARLQAEGACIDGYGIGTKLVTGIPVNGVYKLVEIDGIPVSKKSSGKQTYPGRKQIFRQVKLGDIYTDRLGLATESAQEHEQALLELVIQDGKQIRSSENLKAIAQRTRASVRALPEATRRIETAHPIAIELSHDLRSIIANP
jgi:nicotinate phosphoribosyltransferase